MALAAVEASLYSGRTYIPVTAGHLSLEHLLPQQWDTHCSLTDSEGSILEGAELENATKRAFARLDRLGI